MISKYNDFLLEKEFDNIIDDIFRLVESEGVWTSDNTVEWDLTDDKTNQNDVTEDEDLVSRTTTRLKSFISKIPKDKIRSYYISLVNRLSKLPEKTRRYLLTHYTSVFLSVVSIGYLVGHEESPKLDLENDIKVERLDPKIKEEVLELSKKSSFEEAQFSVKEIEAGYSDDKDDTGNYIDVPGGKRFIGTNHGISAPVLQKWMVEKGIKRLPTKEDMMDLPYKTAVEIYKRDYWNAQKLSDICNQSVANIIYDGCVNQGVDAMSGILIDCLHEQGIKAKGWCFTNKGISKLNSCNQEKLFNSIKFGRLERYKKAATWSIHGDGWQNRINSIKFSK